ALAQRVIARDQVKKRGLSRPVRADQPEDRALRNVEVYRVDGGQPAKALGDAAPGQDDLAHARLPFRRRRGNGSRAPARRMPPGISRTTATTSAPVISRWMSRKRDS